MGRLPDSWAGRQITFRVPFNMPGELIVAASQSGVQFPDATFLHNMDKPFEIHRMIPRITGLDTNNAVVVTQPDQQTLQSLVRMRIVDFSKNENLTKAATLMKLFTKGTSEQTWEFAQPYTLVRSEGLQILIDTQAIPAFNPTITNLRIEINFQGFLLAVAPPSEVR
jgi:hypothetical protein